MIALEFASSLKAIDGKRHLALFAPKRALRQGVWEPLCKGPWQGIVREMVKDLEPGGLGKVVSTFTGGSPRRVSVAALPDRMSRHLSPSRATAIAECVTKLGDGGDGLVCAFVLDDPSHYVGAFDRGLDIVQTDRPDLVLESLGRR